MYGLDPRALDDEDTEMWAACAHEAAHAIGGLDSDVDAAVETSKLRAHIHVPMLWGPVDSSGGMWAEGIRADEITPAAVAAGTVSIAQVRTMQVIAAAGGVGDVQFRTEHLGQPHAQAAAWVGRKCGYDDALTDHYRAITGTLTPGEAERLAEDKLARYESRWLDLTERLVESGGALGGRFFEWSSTVKV